MQAGVDEFNGKSKLTVQQANQRDDVPIMLTRIGFSHAFDCIALLIQSTAHLIDRAERARSNHAVNVKRSLKVVGALLQQVGERGRR
jgi:hypothetical protein